MNPVADQPYPLSSLASVVAVALGAMLLFGGYLLLAHGVLSSRVERLKAAEHRKANDETD